MTAALICFAAMLLGVYWLPVSERPTRYARRARREDYVRRERRARLLICCAFVFLFVSLFYSATN